MANFFEQFNNKDNYFSAFGTPTDHSPAFDNVFKDTAPGRILSAFGQGIETGWGNEPLGFSKTTEQFLQDQGLNPQEIKGPIDLINRGFHDAILRPAAIGLDATLRAGSSVLGAYQAGTAQIGEELGTPRFGRDIAALPEAFYGMASVLGIPKLLREARDLKAIGREAVPEEVVKTPPATALEAARTPEQIDQTIKGLTEQKATLTTKGKLAWTGRSYQYFPGEARALTDGELLDLSDSIGLSPADINRTALKDRFTPEEIAVAKDVVEESSNNLMKQIEKAAASGEDSDLENFILRARVHQLLLDRISGQAGEAIKEAEKIEGEPASKTSQQDLNAAKQVAQQAANIQDPAQLNTFVNTINKGPPGVPSGGIPGQLPGGARVPPGGAVPPTAGGGPGGAVPPGGRGGAAVPPGGAGVGAAMPTPASGWRRWLDWLIELRNNGLISGLATHGDYGIGNYLLALARVPEAAIAGQVGAGARTFGRPGGAYSAEAAGRFWGFFAGHREGVLAAAQSMRTGQTTAIPGMPAPYVWPTAIPGMAGEVIRLPARVVSAVHSFFRTVGYRQHLNGIAYREASSMGLQGPAFEAEVNRIVANPMLAQMEEAGREATAQTLMGRGGNWTNAVSDFVNRYPVTRLAVPFVRIGGNILRERFLERTPLGFMDHEIRDNLLGRNGPVAQDHQYGKILWSTAFMGTIVGLAAENLITGGGPAWDEKDKDGKLTHRRAVWLQENQPYSLRVGDHWYSYAHLGVLGGIMQTSADAAEISHEMHQTDIDKWAGLITAGISRSIFSETWLRDLSDIVKAVFDPREREHFLDNFAASFIPYSSFLSQTARTIDPDLRAAHDLISTLKSKIPGLSFSLPNVNDVWGRPIHRGALLPELTAIYQSERANDPVDQVLLNLHMGIAPPSHRVGGVNLSDAQYSILSGVAGKLAHVQLASVVGTPGFQSLPARVQMDIIQKITARTRKLAETTVLMQDPELLGKTLEAKRARLQVE